MAFGVFRLFLVTKTAPKNSQMPKISDFIGALGLGGPRKKMCERVKILDLENPTYAKVFQKLSQTPPKICKRPP